MIIVITSVGPVIIVSNETFIDHFDAVKSLFYTFSKNTDACCRKGQLMEYILLLVGFILLIKGADFSWREVPPWRGS